MSLDDLRTASRAGVRRQGYSSSPAPASRRAIGLPRATDLKGGVEAWPAAGLPTDEGPADVRE